MMNEQRPSMKEPSFWVYTLRNVLMWTLAIVAVIGFSRFLIITGFLELILGMVAYIATKEQRTWHIPFLWVTALLTIASVWVERLFLWSPDQRPANNTVTIVLHVIWLSMILFYSIKSSRKELTDGPGD